MALTEYGQKLQALMEGDSVHMSESQMVRACKYIHASKRFLRTHREGGFIRCDLIGPPMVKKRNFNKL